ncbi:permease [Clostridium swellfunianum]|uniref:permease n=1 Tax=Clostridium swellfunianum TaxID=1367462 RepID=UPI00202FCECD|nr:permease [Clostridium swellfunianum]
MTTLILYGSALALLLLSYIKDKGKTKKALKKAWKSFENVLPQFLGIIFIIGLTLAVLKPEVISKVIGNESGIIGVIIAAVVGSVTLMPTFVAFPTADMLLKNGAGFAQVGALVSTLTLVGVVTYGLEAKYIGKKAAFYRNFIAFIFSFIVAYVIEKVVGGV